MNDINTLKVTPLDDLRNYAAGAVVELPPFADGQPFVARLGRPSMLVLIKSGKIPNTLMSVATSLFNNTVSDEILSNENFFVEMCDVLDILAEATFLEPTYQQMKEIGLELTDEQMLFVFNYTQKGVKALESFRKE